MAADNPPIVLTSIAPTLARPGISGDAHQESCIKSWLEAGALVVSMNSAEEIEQLLPTYPSVKFVLNSSKPRPGRSSIPLISDLLEYGAKLEAGAVFGIVNSDVEFIGDSWLLRGLFREARGGAIFAHRAERSQADVALGPTYLYGFDFFAQDNRYVVPSETGPFQIGAPWWDYLFLFQMAARGVPLTVVEAPVISHLTHEQAWSYERWLFGLQVTAKALRERADQEGAAAAILAHFCMNLEADTQPGFAFEHVIPQFGTALGAAMVAYIRRSCQYGLWVDEAVSEWENEGVSGHLTRRLLLRSDPTFSEYKALRSDSVA